MAPCRYFSLCAVVKGSGALEHWHRWNKMTLHRMQRAGDVPMTSWLVGGRAVLEGEPPDPPAPLTAELLSQTLSSRWRHFTQGQ